MPIPFLGIDARRWTIAALLTLVPLLSARTARACQCSGEFTQKDVDQAVAVFAGTVTDVEFLEQDAPQDIYACTGTMLLDQATKSLKVLGRPGWKPPRAEAE